MNSNSNIHARFLPRNCPKFKLEIRNNVVCLYCTIYLAIDAHMHMHSVEMMFEYCCNWHAQKKDSEKLEKKCKKKITGTQRQI